MNKKVFTKILKDFGYSENTIKQLRTGRCKPSYEKMIILHTVHGIPFTACQDIKAYLQEHDNTKQSTESSTSPTEKVQA